MLLAVLLNEALLRRYSRPEANFRKVFATLILAIGRSRLRNDWCEFSNLLLRQRPQVWLAALPIAWIVGRYDRSLSVTIVAGGP